MEQESGLALGVRAGLGLEFGTWNQVDRAGKIRYRTTTISGRTVEYNSLALSVGA